MSVNTIELPKSSFRVERGDWQTPKELAQRICRLVHSFIEPEIILEPNCGLGAFVHAVKKEFSKAEQIWGIDINDDYIQKTLQIDDIRVNVQQADFFENRWKQIIDSNNQSVLLIGNPPWVTNSELMRLDSNNVPNKRNSLGLSGIEALTGKSNFDISEWMIEQEIHALQGRKAVLAMLCKTSVARKILNSIWKQEQKFTLAHIYEIDANRFFNVSVEACLLLIQFNPQTDKISNPCQVYEDLGAIVPSSVIAIRNGILIKNADFIDSHLELITPDKSQISWRSGIKHDCSKVMELLRVRDNIYRNGFEETIELESDCIYPLFKSSDLANGRTEKANRFMLVTQTRVGQNYNYLQQEFPLTWQYLQDHREDFTRRKSSIYNKNQPFSIFGVGEYSFTPWKVAISGLYRSLSFQIIGPQGSRPAVFDDTCYFFPCQSEAQAQFIKDLLDSQIAIKTLNSIIFWDSKRPVKRDVLNQLNLYRLSEYLGCQSEYEQLFETEISSDVQQSLFD